MKTIILSLLLLPATVMAQDDVATGAKKAGQVTGKAAVEVSEVAVKVATSTASLAKKAGKGVASAAKKFAGLFN